MEQRTYTVLYEKGPTSWGASSPDATGCFAVAETREECEQLMAGAMQSYFDALIADGDPIPEPVHYAGVVTVTVPARELASAA